MSSDAYYYSGGRRVPLVRRGDLVAVRLRAPERALRGVAPEALARKLRRYPLVEERPDVRLAVLRVPGTRGAAPARTELEADPEIEWTTPVYSLEGSDEPMLITDELVCQFKTGVSRAEQERLHRRLGAAVVAPLDFAPNAYTLRVDPRAANAVEVANRYVESGLVEFAHADFVKPRAPKAARSTQAARRTQTALSTQIAHFSRSRARAPGTHPDLLAREWHLANTGQSGGAAGADSRVVEAWRTTRGDRVVVVAVIDDGFDVGHGDFGPAGRVVSPLDVRSGSPDPRPRQAHESHGTCVLGVAGSGGDLSGVLGVAPEASVMPVRLDGGERLEAQALASAARAGAWVINCSWGPADGAWWDPRDPLHQRRVPLPDVVRAALRFALERGRDGRGTVVVWAAGNGNESVSNDGYASAPEVIAVAATNHRDLRAVYSDFGPEVALAAPSSDLDRARGVIGGIYATDRRGADGYNPRADYTDAFGGTSAAAPVVAGVAALVLAVNPELTRDQVAALLESTAERVDPAHPSWKRRDGRFHSDLYGAGRVDAARARPRRGRRPGS